MAKLLQAQSAQLAGDRPRAVAAYNSMLEHQDTHGIGLRGLHVEARRAGDPSAALQYTPRAPPRSPAAWARPAAPDAPRPWRGWAPAPGACGAQARRDPSCHAP